MSITDSSTTRTDRSPVLSLGALVADFEQPGGPIFACPSWCTSESHEFMAFDDGGWAYQHEAALSGVVLGAPGGDEVSPYLAVEHRLFEDDGRLRIVRGRPFVAFDDSLRGVQLDPAMLEALADSLRNAADALREVLADEV